MRSFLLILVALYTAHATARPFSSAQDFIQKTLWDNPKDDDPKNGHHPELTSPQIPDPKQSQRLNDALQDLRNVGVGKTYDLSIPDYPIANAVLRARIIQSLEYYFTELLRIRTEVADINSRLKAIDRNRFQYKADEFERALERELTLFLPEKHRLISGWYTSALRRVETLNEEGRDPSSLIDICQTYMCMVTLEKDLNAWFEYAYGLNEDIHFAKFDYSGILTKSHEYTPNHTITYSLENFRKEMIQVGLEKNVEYTIPSAVLEYLTDVVVKSPAGIIAGFLQAPAYVFEEVGGFFTDFFKTKIMDVSLDLDAIGMDRPKQKLKRLQEMVEERSKRSSIPNVLFLEEETSTEIRDRNQAAKDSVERSATIQAILQGWINEEEGKSLGHTATSQELEGAKLNEEKRQEEIRKKEAEKTSRVNEELKKEEREYKHSTLDPTLTLGVGGAAWDERKSLVLAVNYDGIEPPSIPEWKFIEIKTTTHLEKTSDGSIGVPYLDVEIAPFQYMSPGDSDFHGVMNLLKVRLGRNLDLGIDGMASMYLPFLGDIEMTNETTDSLEENQGSFARFALQFLGGSYFIWAKERQEEIIREAYEKYGSEIHLELIRENLKPNLEFAVVGFEASMGFNAYVSGHHRLRFVLGGKGQYLAMQPKGGSWYGIGQIYADLSYVLRKNLELYAHAQVHADQWTGAEFTRDEIVNPPSNTAKTIDPTAPEIKKTKYALELPSLNRAGGFVEMGLRLDL